MRSKLISITVLHRVPKGEKILLSRQSKPTNVLILRRVVMSVIDRKARSRTIPVFFELELAPPSVRHARPSKLSAEEMNFLWPRHSPASRMVPRSIVPDFCFRRKGVPQEERNAPLHGNVELRFLLFHVNCREAADINRRCIVGDRRDSQACQGF